MANARCTLNEIRKLAIELPRLKVLQLPLMSMAFVSELPCLKCRNRYESMVGRGALFELETAKVEYSRV